MNDDVEQFELEPVPESISGEYLVLSDPPPMDELKDDIFLPADAQPEREVRIINKNFSLGEYNLSWTKIERYLFLEIYNVIKDFYISKNDELIQSMTEDNITIKLPVSLINRRLIKTKNRVQQLMDAAEGLMSKQIRLITEDSSGQKGFDFIAIFPRITFDPSKDKKHMYIRMQSEIYEKMVPIESYAQLDLRLIEEINKGNSIRLYEIFKSYSFMRNFEISFDDLRKQMGFFRQGVHKEWKHFNYQVLKVAVDEINSRKEYDIEVSYEKRRGSDDIAFEVITHVNQDRPKIELLSLDEPIDSESRMPNMVQRKFIKTTISNCRRVVEITDPRELTEWIVSDLINQQKKQGEGFDFKRAMNAISLQIRKGKYTEPFSHKYLSAKEQVYSFDDTVYRDIKMLETQGKYQELRDKYSDAELIANRSSYLIETFELENIIKSE